MADVKKAVAAAKLAEKPVAATKPAVETKPEAAAKPAAEVKPAAAKKTAAKKPAAAKKTTAKKTAAKKPAAAKKTTAKKTAAKPAAKKAESTVITFQFAGKEYKPEDFVKIAKDVWKYDLGKKAADFKSVELYVKPEESKVYYVINEEQSGSFDI